MTNNDRKAKTERLYKKSYDETTNEYLRDMVYECIDAGLLEVNIDPETGEERFRPTSYGLSLFGDKGE